jgi:hypothetical protein
MTESPSPFGSSSASLQVSNAISLGDWNSDYGLHHHNQWSRIRCINTSGEAVYILAAISYIIPLIALFSRFFYNAYVKNTARFSRAPKTSGKVEDSKPKARCPGEKDITSEAVCQEIIETCS